MPIDAEIRGLLAERRRRMLRPASAPIMRYQIMSRLGEHEVPVENGEYPNEREARARMKSLRPRRGECLALYDAFRGESQHGGVIMQSGDCAKEECAGGEDRVVLSERRAKRISRNPKRSRASDDEAEVEPESAVSDEKRRLISARKIWLSWLKDMERQVKVSRDEGWRKSAFTADRGTKKLKALLHQYCSGRIPRPTNESVEERFGALFELVLPDKTMGYPTGFAYTALPVGSQRGTGVSPSACGDIEGGRYQNYMDRGTIRARKRGERSYRVGGGRVVQGVKARA